jgi:hypothetical protein
MIDGVPRGEDRREAIIRLSFARFDIRALATATGLVTGGVLWLATAALLFKGASPDVQVGAHLAQLASFFPGFTVTWTGSLVGLAYGFVLGFLIGATLAFSWNLSHFFVLMRARGQYGQGGDL